MEIPNQQSAHLRLVILVSYATYFLQGLLSAGVGGGDRGER